MRANITINDAGIILAASNAPPPIGGAAVSRVNQKMSITLGAKPTVPALLSLIRALRAAKTTIRLYHSDENLAWPKPPPLLAQSLEHCLDSPFNYWLAITCETAMAIRRPLYQHGMIRIDQGSERQFKRIIYPIIPANERASNHRILSTAHLLDDPDTLII